MRTFSLVLLGLAVGAALLSRSPSRPAPTPPEPAASAPALADLETLEFWEQGSYIQPISRTCLTRTPEGTRVELELYHEEVYQEQAGPELPAGSRPCRRHPHRSPRGKQVSPKLPGRDERSGRPYRRRSEKRPAAIHPITEGSTP